MRSDLLQRGPGDRSSPAGAVGTLAFILGGLFLVWSSDIHFILWHSVGYHSIPTIGDLFVLQSIAALVLGVLVIAIRRVWVAIGAIGFAASTMAGFLLTVLLPKGMFNFKESWLAPFAKQAFVIELAAIVLLLFAAAVSLAGSASTSRAGTPAGIPSSGA
jgi:hypothetical protein